MTDKTTHLRDLKPDPKNARKHNPRNVGMIEDAMREVGAARSIVIDENGVVLAGNATIEAAAAAGIERVQVVDADGETIVAVRRRGLTAQQKARLALFDNRTAEIAEWDLPNLEALSKELDLSGLFTDDELAGILSKMDKVELNGDLDGAPAPPDDPITKRGDLWTLGNHRLLCGDSSVEGDVDRLVDGQSIHMVNTDPPYNVKVEPRSNNAIAAGLGTKGDVPNKQRAALHHQQLDLARRPSAAKATTRKMRAKDRALENDFISDEAFDALLRAWFGNLARVLIPGGGFYIWGGYSNIKNYPSAIEESGLYFSQAIIWVKGHPVLTRKDFMGDHEWAFYGWREGAAHRWFGPNNARDVWEVKKVAGQSMVHLTEKPVELATMALEYSSQRGDRILDLFGGSGSTLMGCEQTGRKAHLMEIDPAYCDVIVERWQNATGGKAKREKGSRA